MKRILGIFLVAVLGVIAPVIPASAADTIPATIYVATSGAANLGGGSSCDNPHFSGSTGASIQDALDLAASANPATMAFTDVGFASYTGSYTTIVLCEGTWTLSQTLKADANVIIKGAGYKKTIISGNNSVRILRIGNYDPLTEPVDAETAGSGLNGLGHAIGFAARVQIEDVTLKNGSTSGAGISGYGGAVLIQGRDSLKATRVFFDSNSAVRGSAVMALGNSGDLDEAFEPAGSPSGDVIVDSSAFTRNSSTTSGVIEAHRYQRGGSGIPLFQNLSFYRNSASYTLSFGFSDGRSYGNSFVDNQTNGTPELNAGGTNEIRGNVFAQNNSIDMCTQGAPVYADTVSTGPCGATGSTTTISPYLSEGATKGIDPLSLFYADTIPVQRFGNTSSVRGVWDELMACPQLDAEGATRPRVNGFCDAGPLTQPTLIAQADWLKQPIYSQVGNRFLLTQAPSNGSGNQIIYSTSTSSTCTVDKQSGEVTVHVNNASCRVSWESRATESNEADLVGSKVLDFAFTGNSGWVSSTNGFAALHDNVRGVSYFVGISGKIDKLDSAGTFTEAWVDLSVADANPDWNGNTWSANIGSNGQLYVAYWNGKIAVISPDGTVNTTSLRYTKADIAAFTIGEDGDLYLATCDATENLITKISIVDGQESTWATMPSGWCPSYLKFDSTGKLFVVDWYRSGVLRFESPSTSIVFDDSDAGWAQQIAIDSSDNVYVPNVDARKISKIDVTGDFEAAWVTLPTFCEPRGIITGTQNNIFIACYGSPKILEVNITSKEITEIYKAQTSQRWNQLALTNSNYLIVPSENGQNLELSVSEASQKALTIEATVLISGQTAQIRKSGGDGNGSMRFDTLTSSSCTVDSSGLVTKISSGECKVTAYKRGDLDFKPTYSETLTVTFTAGIPAQSSGGGYETKNIDHVDVPIAPIKAIKDLVTELFKALTPDKIATITADEAKNITQNKIKSLVSTQLKALAVEVFASLKPSVVAAISPSRLKLLTAAQKKAITSAQLKALSKAQRRALGR